MLKNFKLTKIIKTSLFTMMLAYPFIYLNANETPIPMLELLSVDGVEKRAALKQEKGEVIVVKEGDALLKGDWQVERIFNEKILLRWQGDAEFIGNKLLIELKQNGVSKKSLLLAKPVTR